MMPGSWASWKSASVNEQSSSRLFLSVAERNEISAPWHSRMSTCLNEASAMSKPVSRHPMNSVRSIVALRHKPLARSQRLESHVGEGEPLEARLTQVGVAQAGPLDSHVPGHGVRQPALHDVQVGVHAVIADLEVP